MIRIGLGRDLHRLVSGRPFVLGGVRIPADRGELGHSDGDALCHAIIDALLGASALEDIGELFPPEDPAWKDADSRKLLGLVYKRVRAAGWNVVNLDCVVTCDKPRLLPHREEIRRSLAMILEMPLDAVFVKGKTSEGFQEEAVEVLAAALLEKDEQP